MQEAKVRIGSDDVLSEEKGSSGTYGNWNFIKPPLSDFIPAWIIPDNVNLPPDPCDFMNACFSVSNITSVKSFLRNKLYLRSYGSDECIVAAPNVDLRTKLAFNIAQDEEGFYLKLTGVFLHKGFPAYELFIEDAAGKKIFLFTDGPEKEEDIALDLAPPLYDGIGFIDVRVPLDENGNFQEVFEVTDIVVGESNLSTNQVLLNSFGSPPLSFLPVVALRDGLLTVNQLTFSYERLSIQAWNQSHLTKEPSGDYRNVE